MEDLLISNTKHCETVIEQTDRKADESLEYKMTKSREMFHFNPRLSMEGCWVFGLTSLVDYNSFLNITEENNKFELHKGPLETEFSYTTLKDKVAEVLDLSDLSGEDLSHDLFGQGIIKFYRKLSIEKSQTDCYYILLKRYLQTPFRNFERFLRILTGLKEEDAQLIIKQYDSKFKTYKTSPGIYTFEGLSEVFFKGFQN